KVSYWDNNAQWLHSGLIALLAVLPILWFRLQKNRLDPRGKHVESKIKKLHGSLTNENGVVMANVEDLCTLLLYAGRIREAERLSRKLFKMAEEAPDLVA